MLSLSKHVIPGALALLLLAAAPSALAQKFLAQTDVGLAVGGMNYIGDLNRQHFTGAVRPAAALLGRYRMGERWAVTVSASYGRVVGGDPDIDALRNLSFRSPILEGALRVEFNFVPFGSNGYCFRTAPYLFAGVGCFHFNPQARYHDDATDEDRWVDLQPLHTEGQGSADYPDRKPYNLLKMTIPFGMGVKMVLTEDITLAVEYGYRFTWTDYLDDVSTTYVGAEVLGEGSTAALLADRSGEVRDGYVNVAGMQRGDDSLNDAYAFFNVSLTFSMDMLFGWTRSKRCD